MRCRAAVRHGEGCWKGRNALKPREMTSVRQAAPAPFPLQKGRVNGDPLPPPSGKQQIFKAGEMAVHPKHGVGEVTEIEERDLGGKKAQFYVLKIVDSGLKEMVPTEAAERVGLRSIMKKKEAQGIFEILKTPEVAVDVQPWNRRFRAYTEMLKSGLPTEIAKVLRDMYRLKFDKDLSFGERRLLDQARSLLVQELALAKKVKPDAIEGEIQQILST
jgi:CarD family transcriptional regulator